MASRGRGRGRGGGPRMGGPMANNMSFAPQLAELQASIQDSPQKLYPEFVIPEAKHPTQDEKLQIKFFKEVQTSIINETPFYVQIREKVTGTTGDGIERYSDRWRPKQKVAQSLVDLRTDEKYFPEELLPVLHGDIVGRKKRKQQTFDLSKFLDMNTEADVDAAETSSALGDAPGEPGDKGSDEDGEAEEDPDDAFSDDGNDYEDNYFSGGENDFEDIGGDEEAY
ncbi:DNA-directed RNA polymerase III subunit rpc31 [Taphrina deformans PYCC 5710]|uniref:DNA-directed RNA polymerase III subunit n=1 Tax=Taphrina deformans (strain PYCC 5710 / ATCC 11124 / CBS 356.35 / IMI 108563 / JCM 9778 / NBRC 8474) TaxID=1097556 RepID=R4X7B3_TAPDE|nr:DNA-directed RNA polymerase III subunit rpc31 [Taphrina deformans PYCC 5710]|eukprot:CCG81201.1 DNA-directed RNA polymerase III subunit rpc31 [Taphrina deformans PYCC 5710]